MEVVKLIKQASPISNDQIEQFERRNGVILPKEYKAFLLRTNGGEPTFARLIVPGWHGHSTGLNRFFGLGQGGDYDLEKILRGGEDYVPRDFVPIADDSGGNMLCIGTSESQTGKIFFWDHEAVHGDDPRNLYEVAGNITELLEKKLTAD